MATQYDARTKNGYNLFEVASALQKSIRRGIEDEALYWTVELDRSNYGEYAWKRLRIMSSEDVGLAEPNISANIQALYSLWTEQRKKKDEKHAPERLFLIHACLLLVRAKKSRIVDHALITYYNLIDQGGDGREIPEFAFDKHNAKGRSMGRGVDHFFTDGIKLGNESEIPDIYLKTAWKAAKGGKNPPVSDQNGEELPEMTKEQVMQKIAKTTLFE